MQEISRWELKTTRGTELGVQPMGVEDYTWNRTESAAETEGRRASRTPFFFSLSKPVDKIGVLSRHAGYIS